VLQRPVETVVKADTVAKKGMFPLASNALITKKASSINKGVLMMIGYIVTLGLKLIGGSSDLSRRNAMS